MNKKIYFSFPYTIQDTIAEEAKEKIMELGDLSYYIKGTEYTDKPIRECDVFAIMLPGNAFSYEINKLSMGVKKELTLAHSLKKNIILVYYSKLADGITFYLVNMERGTIEGISGTNSDVIKMIEEEKPMEMGEADVDLSFMKVEVSNIIL